MTTPSREITVGSVADLLEDRDDDLSLRTARLARQLAPDDRLRVGVQQAARTAETFRFKYSMAGERGADVIGLELLTERLDALGSTDVAGCVLQSTRDFAVVVLNDRLTEIGGMIYVDPAR